MDTITIIFPEVKIEISISDLTFDTLEKLIFEIIQNIAGQVFAQAITIIDTSLPLFPLFLVQNPHKIKKCYFYPKISMNL